MKKMIVCGILSILFLMTSCSAVWDYLPIEKRTETTIGIETTEPESESGVETGDRTELETEHETEAETKIETEEKTVVDNKNDVYNAIIGDYKLMVEYRASDDFLPNLDNTLYPKLSGEFNRVLRFAPENEKGALEYMIFDMSYCDDFRDLREAGYVFYDLDRDGNDEMFWVRGDHSILSIFTVMSGQVKLVKSFWSRYHCYITQDGEVFTMGSNGAASNSCAVCFLENGELKQKYGFYSQADYLMGEEKVEFYKFFDDNHTKITQEKYEELLEKYSFEQSEFWLSKPINPLFD